ncbi:MAG: MotA/TolQ/ExbB proton channel family protein [Halobacteriovoraceae bacterium]|nr:MotA/TolQ/ExbB proton channel family protein [Halobacteriovoraceae bacterium]
MLDKIIELYFAGGFVMPPLLLGAGLLWYSMTQRIVLLTKGEFGVFKNYMNRIDELKKAHGNRRDAELILSEEEDHMNKFKIVIKSVVILAPLLGLLGTVSGMIETFDSLAEMSLFSQSGGIAGGISQALITTQMGLAVAIPGLIVGRLLERRQLNLLTEMERTIEVKFREGMGEIHA